MRELQLPTHMHMHEPLQDRDHVHASILEIGIQLAFACVHVTGFNYNVELRDESCMKLR